MTQQAHTIPEPAIAQPSLTLQRRLLQIASLPPEERRQIMQLVDAFIERAQLKRRASTPNASG